MPPNRAVGPFFAVVMPAPTPNPPAGAADFPPALLPALLEVSLTAVCVLRPVYGGPAGAAPAD